MSKYNFADLTNDLKTHSECRVVFTKVDGTTRHMRCTLKAEFLPESDRRASGSLLTEGDGASERISVWDLDVGEWRGFRVDSVQSFEVIK
jgi:hypothetical protein